MNILLGVSGGIAAYKAAEIARAFIKRGDEVRVVMTAGAREFITPLTFQALTDHPVGTDLFDAAYESEIGHIDLARWADVVVLAPATANLIARMAQGAASDLLTTVLLATRAPVVVAPAMNTQMWRHPLVERNLRVLRDEAGYHVIDPDSGELACKEVGPGRLPDPPVLLDAVDAVVRDPILAGRQVVVTAGPTREHLDPARFLSNPSTGRMGIELARAARHLGADVTLVCGPTHLAMPYGVEVVQVTTAQQMRDAVFARAAQADFICKAAAVCDWRPAEPSAQKRAKSEIGAELALERNPDILAELGERYGAADAGPILIGFAAETHDVAARAAAKRERKGAHLIVANQIGGARSAFGAETSEVDVLSAERATHLGPAAKYTLALDIWSEALAVEDLLRG